MLYGEGGGKKLEEAEKKNVKKVNEDELFALIVELSKNVKPTAVSSVVKSVSPLPKVELKTDTVEVKSTIPINNALKPFKPTGGFKPPTAGAASGWKVATFTDVK